MYINISRLINVVKFFMIFYVHSVICIIHQTIHVQRVCMPKEYGGLGILNLKKYAWALCLKWIWNEWNDTPKPWVGLESRNP
jgi:hypothetical protein